MVTPNVTITFNPNPTEYRTIRKNILVLGIEEATRVEPPGSDWQLVSVTTIGSDVFFFWRRPVFENNYVVYNDAIEPDPGLL